MLIDVRPAAPVDRAPAVRQRGTYVSTVLLLALLVLGTVTLADPPLWTPESLAYAGAQGWSWRAVVWMFVHADLLHLGGNLAVLCLLAPEVERYRGSVGLLVALVAGHLGALAMHLLTHGSAVPIYGASGAAFAVIGYTATVSWHLGADAPGRWSWALRPGTLLSVLAAVEAGRWVVGVLAGAASGAAAHLGALAAGVLAAGLVHRRWPAASAADATSPGCRRRCGGLRRAVRAVDRADPALS